MKKHLALWFLFFLLFSCSSFFPESQDEAGNPVIAVSSFFSPDSAIRVKVEPVLNTFTPTTGSFVVEEVKVTNCKTGLSAFLEKESEAGSVYSSCQLLPSPGDVFKIEVLADNIPESVSAVDSVPNKVQQFRILNMGVDVKDYSQDMVSEFSIFRKLLIRFLPGHNSQPVYMELVLSENDHLEDIYGEVGARSGFYQPFLQTSTSFIMSEDYYPSPTAMDAAYPQSLLFQCPDTGDSVTVEIIYGSTMAASMNEVISFAHDLVIELRTVSYAYYRYKTALYKQRNAIRGDMVYGAASPVIVPSNVEN
ncbi:MAG: DUF4249 domain-containing protein, partial [Prolixibacteraceae bacterium]|nr:DUF4249 domain-containing protein [Prolixibacteraceae bacterium]